MIRSTARSGHSDRPRPPPAYPPVRNDDRIILHFDYDCFYAQVVQNNPPDGMSRAELAGKPVGVTQKSILATCNYEARRLGVRKLMRITDAVKVLPSMVLVDGEDLSPFRDASKALYRLVQDVVLAGTPVERLGLDEFFIDATALVDANVDRLTKRPASSWSASEFFVIGDGGFAFDCTQLSGCVVGAAATLSGSGDAVFSNHSSAEHTRNMLRFVLGSHLAAYVRSRLHSDGGYTSSGGIATSKLLAKLAGKQNKPANQTTILSLGNEDDMSQDDNGNSVVHAFMDVLPLRGVPGIGYKTATLLSDYIHGKKAQGSNGLKSHPNEQDEEGEDDETVTVATVRQFPGMSPRLLDSILGSAQSSGAAGSAVPSGDRVWQLLHGVDALPVRGGRDLPTQISIEDTYAGPRQGTLKPEAAQAVAAELRRLAASLLRRMHVDLLTENKTWAAKPKTLRLTLRPQLPYVTDNRTNEKNYHFARMSRSEALPGFVLNLTLPPEQVVERLVQGNLVPMFRKLAASVRMPCSSLPSSSRSKTWTVGLLNVCVANMAPVAGDGGIAAMFQKVNEQELEEEVGQGKTTRESNVNGDVNGNHDNDDNGSYDDDEEEMHGWDGGHADTDGSLCRQCGQFLPSFAMEAHTRFHLLGED